MFRYLNLIEPDLTSEEDYHTQKVRNLLTKEEIKFIYI